MIPQQWDDHIKYINISPFSKAMCFLESSPDDSFDRTWVSELQYLIRTNCRNEEKIKGVLTKLGLEKVEQYLEDFMKNKKTSLDLPFF